MDRLPPELYLMIFKFLPVQESIQLKIVCKKWYHLLSGLKHQSLAIFNGPKNYSLRSTPLKTFDLVHNRDEYLLFPIQLPCMFKSVKKLNTHFCSDLIEFSSFYNQFSNLEELACFHQWPLSNKIILNLKHLKSLNIKNFYYVEFELNTPNLIHLNCHTLSRVKLKYPHCLKRLSADLYDHDKIDFSELVDLEFLQITGDWSVLTNSFLMMMSNLKELHFQDGSYMNRQTIDSKFTYRRDDLKIYQFGFAIDSNVEIEDNENFPNESHLKTTKFILKNYDKIGEKVYYQYDIDYNELIKNELPKNFFDKFFKLYSVKIGDKIENEDALIEFLKKTKPCEFLIQNQLPNQTFLDRFVNECPFIKKLNLKNLNQIGNDLDFIFKLSNLNEIEMKQNISIDFLIRLFTVCPNLNQLYLVVDDLNNADFGCNSIFLDIRQDEASDFFSFQNNFKNRSEMINFLLDVRSELELITDLVDLQKLGFLIDQNKYDKFVINEMVTKLFKNETFFIDL